MEETTYDHLCTGSLLLDSIRAFEFSMENNEVLVLLCPRALTKCASQTTLLVLLETKIADDKKLTEELHFDMLIQSPTVGLSGGIVMIWKEDCVTVDEVSTTPQGIHAMVKVLPSHTLWLFSAIYASTILADRKLLWDSLVTISKSNTGNWFIGEEFNEVVKARDKFGGNPINLSRSNLFWNCLNECRLVDLGYKGSKYTWTNKRYKNRSSLILERIDRCFANDCWISQYPDASVNHLPKTNSNHCLYK
uniref:Uncharacterized protein n=1 Tax=Nicotiana tabacum TaxID=4097 RepID=A0A1S4DP63_TOBAC|nr:PREDICTED: uncharacterized protein LOC107831916 [Nicotiana tabacum]